MANWRQAVELAMTDEEIENLAAIARSRSEAARRVERAQILLAYRQKPSFFAVGQRLGLHHQTVQRCVERALAYGPLVALDDRPRPGKEPTITPEAKAWLVSLACDKAKDHGYPHELWTTRLLARHARKHAPAAGPKCFAKLAQRAGGGAQMFCQAGPGPRLQNRRPRGSQATQGAVLSGKARRPTRTEYGGGSVRLS